MVLIYGSWAMVVLVIIGLVMFIKKGFHEIALLAVMVALCFLWIVISFIVINNHMMSEERWVKLPMAEMKTLEQFFSHREEQQEWKEKENFQKLHIEQEAWANIEISMEMIDYFDDLCDNIYKNGNVDTEYVQIDDEETKQKIYDIRKDVTNYKAETADDFMEEYEMWDWLYQTEKLPVDCYQKGRAMRDSFEMETNVSFSDRLYRAAVAVESEETFLTYADRNINDGGENIIINAEDIAFFNGKIFISMSDYARIQGGDYANCFLMIAYSSMRCAKNLMSKDHPDYALVCYYIGMIGERMMNRVSSVSNLYTQLKQEALENYQESLTTLEGTGSYNEEKDMRERIQKSIEIMK